MKPRLLLVHRGAEAFAARDEALLGEAYSVERHNGLRLSDIARAARASLHADAVVCWFVSFHMFVPLVVARLRRRPVVVIPGGYEVSWLPELGYGWQGRAWRRLLVRRVLHAATAVVAVSPTMVELIRQTTGVEALLVPNAVEPADAVAVEQRDIDVVTSSVTTDDAARFNKGLDLFYEVARRCPELRFTMVGPDPGAPALANLTVTGLLSPSEAAALIGRARTYVQATRGSEAFGVAVAEAMARSVRPVVTTTGALPYVVGATGEVVPVDDVDALEQAVRRALARGAADDARARVQEEFSPERRRAGLLRAVRGPADPIT